MDNLNIYILTFNCARTPLDVQRFATHLFDAYPSSPSTSEPTTAPASEPVAEPPDLIIFSLQEVAPIAYSFLGGSLLTPYLDAFDDALNLSVSKRYPPDVHYVRMVREHSGMTALMVFARSDIAGLISGYEVAHVGLGVQEIGNKGAVAARVHVRAGKEIEDRRRRSTASRGGDEERVDFTFVAAHLAPAENAVERRNADWRAMVERLVFTEKRRQGRSPVGGKSTDDDDDDEMAEESTSLLPESGLTPHHTGIYHPTSHLFVAGDLNYRTSDTAPSPLEARTLFPQPTASPSSPTHYSHLLRHDQLTREMRKGNTFHGFSEPPITFPPTYKYSNAARQLAAKESWNDTATSTSTSTEWQWTRYRWPSWCDRIVYLDMPPSMRQADDDNAVGSIKTHSYTSLSLLPTSDHQPVGLAASVPFKPIIVREISPQAIQEDNEEGLRATTGTTGVNVDMDVRLTPPFPIDPEWERKREIALQKEFAVGCLAYLGLTWEGNGILLAAVIGMLGAWYVVQHSLVR